MERRKARVEQADNGWVVILLMGNGQQGDKLVYSEWHQVQQALDIWLNEGKETSHEA